MNLLLTDLSMGLGTAFMYYGVRFIMFAAVAALGIFVGIKMRKNKNKKNEE